MVDIADEVGLSPSAIYRAFDRHDIPRRGRPGARGRAALDPDWLAARCGENLSWHQIAAIARVERSTVVWFAARCGLYDLPDGDHARYRQAVRAADQYRKGSSLAAIASTLHVTRRHVTIWLRGPRRGHPPARPPAQRHDHRRRPSPST